MPRPLPAAGAYPDTPDWEIEAWVSTYTAIAKGELAQVTQDLPRLIGREPLAFEAPPTDFFGGRHDNARVKAFLSRVAH